MSDDVGRERIGTTLGQQFIRPIISIGRSAGTDNDSLYGIVPHGFSYRFYKPVQFDTVVAKRRIYLPMSDDVINTHRIYGLLRLTRPKPQDATNNQ